MEKGDASAATAFLALALVAACFRAFRADASIEVAANIGVSL